MTLTLGQLSWRPKNMVRLYVCASLRIMEGVVIVYLVKLVEGVIAY